MFNFLLDIEFLKLHKNFQFLFILDVSLIFGKLNFFKKPKSLFLANAIFFLFFFIYQKIS